MFELIRLCNFTSFSDITFDLRSRNGEPKRVAVIFGENGSGKSNISSAFYFLSKSIKTMSACRLMQDFIYSSRSQSDDELIAVLSKAKYVNMSSLIDEFKTISSDGTMRLEFTFRLNGRSGIYVMETDNEKITYEKMDFVLSQNRGCYFEVSANNAAINPKIIPDRETYNRIFLSCTKHWGDHSLLSIIFAEIRNMPQGYLKQVFSDNMTDIISFLDSVECRVRFADTPESSILELLDNEFLDNDEGRIPIDAPFSLAQRESEITAFFKKISGEIERMYYEIEEDDAYRYYRLMEEKRIAGELRRIPFTKESSGFQSLLRLLPYLRNSVSGCVSVIDEFDTGIHDMLSKNLLASLCKGEDGQLIVTMHSSAVMDSDIPREYIYVLDTCDNGGHELKSITQSRTQIRQKTSVRKQYMKGNLGGSPAIQDIDFLALLSSMDVFM